MKLSLLSIITSSTLLVTPMLTFSQEVDANPTRRETAAFIGLTAGFGPSSFRDLATSPLIYEGTAAYLSVSRLKKSLRREGEIGGSLAAGVHNSDFNDHSSSSEAMNVTIFYSRLYPLDRLESQKWSVKIGGMLSATSNVRLNEDFGNNGLGFELLPTLYGSVKVTRELSRQFEKDKRLLFIKYRLSPINRNISFRLNPGIVNSALRNKYAYLMHSASLGKSLLDDYEYSLFSGLRFSTAVDYTVQLANKNSYQISYLWDACRTGGNTDKFEMGRSTIKITLLFNTNNRTEQ